ncbi:unnamed protein product [Dicrocoelium dendriticum]|nr:unnamed protein product [Dicrocoelium dendriticum]
MAHIGTDPTATTSTTRTSETNSTPTVETNDDEINAGRTSSGVYISEGNVTEIPDHTNSWGECCSGCSPYMTEHVLILDRSCAFALCIGSADEITNCLIII